MWPIRVWSKPACCRRCAFVQPPPELKELMAASSGDDAPTQLAALLGCEVVRIRKTADVPPKVSLIDVAVLITGKASRNARRAVATVQERHPDVAQHLSHVKLLDSRGRTAPKATPVTDVKGMVEFILLLPGKQAARVRRQAAELLVRYLGGDLAIIDEVCAFRGFQEQLAVQSPNDPRRIFGAAVATSSSTSTKMANMFASEAGGVTNAAVACEQVLGRLLPSLFQKLSEALAAKLAVQIDERLAAFADTSAPRGEKRKERPQPVASNAKMLRLQGEDHLPSADGKYMERLESANTTGTRADLAERHLGQGGED